MKLTISVATAWANRLYIHLMGRNTIKLIGCDYNLDTIQVKFYTVKKVLSCI